MQRQRRHSWEPSSQCLNDGAPAPPVPGAKFGSMHPELPLPPGCLSAAHSQARKALARTTEPRRGSHAPDSDL